MKTILEIRNEIKALNNKYENGEMTYKAYRSKFSKIKNYNSISNQIKRFGTKVVKEGGGYKYVGKNFECNLFLDGCETDFWTTYYKGDNMNLSRELSNYGYSFETKGELLQYLFDLDKNIINNNFKL